MSEPFMPLPPPERNSNVDPLPPRCPHEGCNVILGNVHWTGNSEEGRCPFHGIVRPRYGFSPDPEKT